MIALFVYDNMRRLLVFAALCSALLLIPAGCALAETPDEQRLAQALQDVGTYPENSVAYNNLGVAYRRLGRFEDAVAAYAKSIELDPTIPAVHRNLGFTLMRTGAWHEAGKVFSEALRLDPSHAATHAGLGVALMRLELYNEAIDAFRQALEVNPALEEAASNLELAREMQRKKAAASIPPAPPPAVAGLPATASPGAEPAPGMSSMMERSWGRLVSILEDVLPLWEQHDALPESRIIGTDKASNRRKINALLQEALTLLLSSEANEARERMLDLQTSIPKMRADLETLKIKRISAPTKTTWPWEESAGDIDNKMRALEESLEARRQEVERLRSQVAAYLRSYGLAVDDEHLEVLLSSVLGDDILKNAIVFENVKAVTSKLSELTRESGEELFLARRYYGMYVVLIETLLYLQNQFVEMIETAYLPRLGTVRENSAAMRRKIDESLRTTDFNPTQRRMMESNKDALSLNILAAEKYSQLLTRQKKSILDCTRRLETDLRVAAATYDTVRISGELSDIIRSSIGLFDALMELQIPEIQLFENLEVKKQFQEITFSLKGAGR